MASEIDICNLALAHLGEDGTVSSIDPPEGSSQAGHCARFYPMARDALLEEHSWVFATFRAAPAQVQYTTQTQWQYAYALPSEALRVFAVLLPESTSDYNVAAQPETVVYSDGGMAAPAPLPAGYQTQPFETETMPDGTKVVLTNVQDADIRFVKRVTDTSKFSPLFVIALSRRLAAFLAGPVIKGDVGIRVSEGQYKIYKGVELPEAKNSDANQRFVQVQHSVLWIAARA
jgi:hypothetical protein